MDAVTFRQIIDYVDRRIAWALKSKKLNAGDLVGSIPPIVGGTGATDEKVKATSGDTTANYLDQKLAEGTGISLAILNPGGDEQVEISATGGTIVVKEVDGSPSVVADTLILPNGTVTDNGDGSATYTPTGGGGGGSGAELDYVQRTSDPTGTSITATEGSPTTVLTSNSITVDGSTPIIVEFYASVFEASTSAALIANLWEGTTTDLGRLINIQATVTAHARRRFTPSAGSHTYTIRLWRSGSATARIYSDVGGAGKYMPAFMRISEA